jgi:diguanylate cyclase (GGDEF)-like protein
MSPSLTPRLCAAASLILDAAAAACLTAMLWTGSLTVWLDGCYAAIAVGVFVRPGGVQGAVRALAVTAVALGWTLSGHAPPPDWLAHAGLMLVMALVLSAYVEARERANRIARDATAAARIQADRAAAVIDVAGEFTSSLDLSQVLGRFAERTRGLFDASSIELSWLDLSRDALVMLVEWVDRAPVVTTTGGSVYALTDFPLTRRVLVDKVPAQVRVADPDADPAEVPLLRSQELGSLLMIPLLWHDVSIGLVEVIDEGDRVFTPAEVDLCRDLARMAASAVYNAIAFERTRESSVRDPATGLHNRRFFDEVLPAELARARRSGEPVSLVMLDVDGLKRVNDSQGHQGGDQMLLALADALRAAVRGSDAACRLGGDEFAVILPGADAAGALRVAARVRRAFAAAGEYRFSAGIAVYPAHATTPHDLCRAADVASYASKSSGGGRTTVAGLEAAA